MMNKIGYYQFDNLIRNRIPFLLLNLGQDVSAWYESIFKQHLETQQRRVDDSEIDALLKMEKIPKEFPILLLCQNGRVSSKVSETLTKQGYSNVYLIDGGIQQMMTDKSLS